MWISGTDWNAARIASHGSSGGFGGANAALFFARHGLLDEEALAKVRARTNDYASMVPQVPQVPGRYRRLICAEAPQSAADLLMVLFKRKLDLHQTTFAWGESVAHLHALAGPGQLREHQGADGVLRFETVL